MNPVTVAARLDTDAGLRGRIGPNAITRVAEALQQRLGPVQTRQLFEAAGLLHHLLAPPQNMVHEAEVRNLHGVLRQVLGSSLAAAVARDAGHRTAQYLLAHRIPRPVQALLKRLPARWAARVLLAAITRHAWTFAGSGQFAAQLAPRGAGVQLSIRHNPLCLGLHSQTPACHFYAATFQHLFATLVHPGARVIETTCEASGGDTCRFEVLILEDCLDLETARASIRAAAKDGGLRSRQNTLCGFRQVAVQTQLALNGVGTCDVGAVGLEVNHRGGGENTIQYRCYEPVFGA